MSRGTYTVTVTTQGGRSTHHNVASWRRDFGALVIRTTDGAERCYSRYWWTSYLVVPDQRDEDDEPTDTTVPTPADLARKAKP